MEGEQKSKHQLHYERYKDTILGYQKKNRESYNKYAREYQQRKRDELKLKKEQDIIDAYLSKNGLTLEMC